MNKQMGLVGFLAAALVVACGSTPGMCDLPELIVRGESALVGEWEGRYTSTGRIKSQLKMSADGTFDAAFYSRTGDLGQRITGTYSVNGHFIKIEGRAGDGTSYRTVENFYVDAQRLALTAYYPSGTTTGLVGKWADQQESGELDASGNYRLGAKKVDMLDIRADRSVVVTEDREFFASAERPTRRAFDATYVAGPGGTYTFTARDSQTNGWSTTLISIDDRVLITSSPLTRVIR